MQRLVAILLFVLFFVAFFGFLIGIPLLSAGLQRRRDRRRTIAEGKTADAVIARLVPDKKPDCCRVLFTFQPDFGGARIEGSQRSTFGVVKALGLKEGAQVRVRYLPKCPRYAFIDALIVAERLQALQGTAGDTSSTEVSSASVHFISYSDPLRKAALPTTRSTSGWTGNGDITIGRGVVRFTAQRARPFWFPKSVKEEFPLTSVGNVEVFGNAVRCEISPPNAKPRALQFWAVSSEEAKAIGAQLPDSKTSSFTPQLAEAAAFKSRLIEVTPHAPVTPAIIAINVAMFAIAAYLGGGILVPNPEVMIRLGSDYTPLTAGGEWWRLLTSTFLHFGLLHLGFNMWALWVSGIPTERLYGSTRFLLLYMVAGVVGSVTSFLWHPFVNGAGASGAIFGVFGAQFAYFLRTDSGIPASVLTTQRKTAALFIVVSITNAARVHGVDNAAHLGGLIAGFLMGLLLARPLDAKRDQGDWTAQWLRAFSIVFAGAFLVGYYLRSGVWHPRVLHDPSGRPILVTELLPLPDGLGGVRLGMTSDQLRRVKGKAIREEGDRWFYNSIDEAHDGLLEVVFQNSGQGASPIVWAVFYWGRHAAEPPGLPDLLDFSREDLVARYGNPTREDGAGGGWGYLFFQNGLSVSLEANKVKGYGVYRTAR
jgi:membrane associated rhomboid family serine protease